MWCNKCQADVAGIASSDNERAFCTSCGTELVRSASAGASPVIPATDAARTLRDPRELLARWAREDALDRIEIGSPVIREPGAEKPKPALRFDGSHSVLPAASTALTDNLPRAAPPVSVPSPAEVAPTVSQDVIIHQPHEANAPHFTAIPISLADKSTRWVTLVGQIMAYLGVGGLTVGTSLILMGYFGGPASYATTGWLVTTAGQMLLFLGVVTLVSGGMEQTTQEVARRIDLLGERLGRIEQTGFVGKSQAPSQRAEVKK
ncbi:MAG TPA: hypothetical protein VGM05_13030 [Planctomycetaceae bacterium]|jgi:hypothetical protein